MVAIGERLKGDHITTIRLERWRHATVHRLPIQDHGAGATIALTAAILGAGQAQILADHIAQSDAVITTALVPGRPAPKLITKDMVEEMRDGAVMDGIADMIHEVQVEATFPDGTKLVTVHNPIR